MKTFKAKLSTQKVSTHIHVVSTPEDLEVIMKNLNAIKLTELKILKNAYIQKQNFLKNLKWSMLKWPKKIKKCILGKKYWHMFLRCRHMKPKNA